MAKNPRQDRLLQTLVQRGLLSDSKLGSMKAPKIKAPSSSSRPDYASYLLSGALNNKGVGRAMSRALASSKSAEEEEQSYISKLLDAMLTTNYAAANIGSAFASGMDEEDSFLENVGDVVGGVGKAIVGGASAVATDVFGQGLQRLPFGIGDKFDEVFEESPFKQEKKTFQNVLGEDLGIENKYIRHGLGFGLDIGLDPLTYTGFGFARRGVQAAANAGEELTRRAAIPEAILKPGTKYSVNEAGRPFIERPKLAKPSVATDVTQGGKVPFTQEAVPQLPRQDVKSLLPEIDQVPFTPRTRGLQRRTDRVAAKQELPVASDLTERMVRRQKDWERSMTKLGKVTEGTRLNMRAANEVVRQIQEGKVPRVLPKPPVVQGPAVERARDIADDVIDSLMGQKKNAGKKLTWRGPDGRITTRKLPPELTAGMQITLANKVFAATGPKNLDEGIGVLRAAEDHMISLGVHPVRHEGVRVRLSDVMNLLKDKVEPEVIFNNFARKNMKEMDPAVREAIQTVAAYRSATMADILENLTTFAEKAKRGIADSYVGGQKSAAEAKLLDDSINAASKMGMTRGELDKVKNLIRDVINVDKIPAEKFFTTASDELMKAFNEGRASGTLISKFNKLVAENYGYGTQASIAEKVTGIRVLDTLMGAFVTHHGKGQFFSKAQGLFNAGEQIAGARATWLRNMSRKYSKEEISNAWKLAAGKSTDEVSDPRVREMADFFQGYFHEVLKVPSYALRLSNPATQHLSVAERSTLLMKDVNRHLKDMGNSFQFTNKNFQRDAWGVQRHFGKDQEGWLASWATQDPTDPLKFLYDIDLAIDRATREYAFLDNFVSTFGSLSKDSFHNFKMPLDRISDFYVPQEVGHQMMRVMSDIHKGHWRARTPLTNFYTQMLRAWKSSVTIYMPSHHIRNGIGDAYLMWLAGHNNPLAFKYSARILASQRGRYKAAMKDPDGLKILSELTDPEAVKRANIAATQGKDIILNINGIKLTADQLYTNAFHRGLLKDANRLEDIFGESKIGGSQIFKGRVHAVPAGAAEYREHFIRMAHFTSSVQKSLKKGRKDLDSIFDDAAKEVAKWHPDGTDLTRFEEKYLRQVIPFYSWLRKSTPLLVESLVTRPAKNLTYPRGMSALQNMMGIESTVSDPFPDDQLFPEWLKESGIGPIGDPTSSNPLVAWWGNLGRNMINIEGDPYGYTVINPGNPFIDQMRTTFGFGGTPRDIFKGLYDQSTPALKIPIALGYTGQEETGAKIYPDEGGRGVGQYLMKQHGATAPFQRYFDIGETEREGVEPQKFDVPAFLNNLFASGIYGTGPYIKSAEFELKEKLAAEARRRANK